MGNEIPGECPTGSGQTFEEDVRITLCGSTRFKAQFEEWNHKLAIKGHTVYSLSLFGREEKDLGKGGNITITEAEKITLDLVHLDKILNSDAIVVINVDGYVGFSTSREIQWAQIQKKLIFWAEGTPWAGALS